MNPPLISSGVTHLIKQCVDDIRAELGKESSLTVQELAARLGRSENLVRRGLDVLLFVGAVEETHRARNAQRRGAIPKVYSLSN
jgi:predicted ArsR family transcriptional regulator